MTGGAEGPTDAEAEAEVTENAAAGSDGRTAGQDDEGQPEN
ncbi:hypothetical protein [Streptomyces sp. HB132]|nr:hypothetical protein [Streptomyces sp. HB132]MBM7441164.1 hypothetical protein [Streptomyces sp. HB132]